MCGIAGFLGYFEPTFLEMANAVMSHRGPDDFGVWFDEEKSIGLAHRRLSIIDLSSNAKQPMTNAQRTISIVFNGEIYNYRELRKELEGKGYSFRTQSDTEVLIHLYDEFGHAMLDKLNGIFAFAIWDHQKDELFLGRDGIGVKPLYCAQNEKGFIFASELKALLQEPSVDRSLNVEAVHYYLAYLWCPAPHTMFKSVFKLEPGYALLVKGGKVKKKWCFYELPYARPTFQSSESEIAEALAECIKTAVHRQMVSDAPVGAFLSGGLDSSAVVAFAQEMDTERKLDCYTIGFENDHEKIEGFPVDLPYAKEVAQSTGVNLHVVNVGSDIISRLEEMIYFLDEPQSDTAPLNVLFICELARENGIKVLLSGAGGDDIFSGYRRHFALMAERYWSWLPKAALKTLRISSNKLPQSNAVGRRISKAFRYADSNDEERLIGYFLWLDENVQRSLYTDDLRSALKNTEAVDPLRNTLRRIPNEKSQLNRMLYLEAKHFLPDHNLNYTDKMGMAAGVEVRVPLLDMELIDFATQIPPKLKQKGMVGKYIFRKAMEPYLPNDVINRSKSGFGTPLRYWLRNELRDVVKDVLSKDSLKKRGLFEWNAVNSLVEQDRRGEIDAAYTIFSMMCIEIWCRMFVDGMSPSRLDAIPYRAESRS